MKKLINEPKNPDRAHHNNIQLFGKLFDLLQNGLSLGMLSVSLLFLDEYTGGVP